MIARGCWLSFICGLVALVAATAHAQTRWGSFGSADSAPAAANAGAPSFPGASAAPASAARPQGNGSIIRHVTSDVERLRMITLTSRMVTLERRIKEATIDNPEVADVQPRSANQLSILAKKPGFTIITLKDEDNQAHSIELQVINDARELADLLTRKFPAARIEVTPLSQRVLLEGTVDDPEDVRRMENISKEFFPDVINHISVGGVRQVLLQVRVMEVSRSKLRTMGFDFARTIGNDFSVSSVSGLITSFAGGAVTTAASETFTFGLIGNDSSFFGVLEALRQNNLAKVLAEPELVTVSGRPAMFRAGGSFPVPVPQSLGTISIEFKDFGTQVDFVPIVLANGNIRLEVRPRVSEIDSTRGVTINNITIPALRVRECDTGVEMRTGQTLAIAGLVQTRQESETKGFPYLMDIPYLGGAFRRVQNVDNEIELLITVTPHLVEPLECDEVPQMGPGLHTGSPRDCELYFKSYLETPNCCLPESGAHPVGPGQHGYHEGDLEEVQPRQGGPDGGLPITGAPAASRSRSGRQAPPQPSRQITTRPGGRQAAPQASVQRIGPADSSPGAQGKARSSGNSGQRANNPYNRQTPAEHAEIVPAQGAPGFLGDTGYDVRK